jgi:hypothetical protein
VVLVREIDGVWKVETNGRAVAIHSRDPQREADTAVSRLLAQTPSLIVALGLGLGYLLDALDRAGWAGKVLAIEPEPATVEPLMQRPIARDWLRDGRLRVLVAPAFDGASDSWPLFDDGRAEPAVHVNSTLERLYPEAVQTGRALAARLRAEAASNAHARQTLGARYLLNTLRNLPAIAGEGNVADLFGAAATPAIVIAAGPSLDRALPALRAAKDSALLICVDTALRPLLAAGIHPHVVVSVDPSEANARHLADIPHCPDTCLVAEGSLDPLAIAPFRGRTFFLNVSNHQPWPWLEQHGHGVGRLRAWGSVLTSAFDLALEMGCNPIVFAGADLAYTDDRPYCRGVVFEEDWQRRSEWGAPHAQQWLDAIDRHPRVDETGVHGEPVRTAPHLLAFRNWLLEQMRRVANRRFVNVTGGGILHGDGIGQLAFADLPAALGPSAVSPTLVRDRHRPRSSSLLLEATRLAQGVAAGDPTAEGVISAWEQFAPGLSRELMLPLLSRRAPAALTNAAPPPPTGMYSEIAMTPEWLAPWTRAVPLVPMRIPPYRITEWSGVGARMFFFRTMAARLIMCSLQPPEGGLLEDGQPLTLAPSIDDVTAGMYRTCKDELHFQSSDGTDPRWNGRAYVLMVPPCIAELEALPLDEILARRL